jgi:hypothetical protein
MDIEKLADELDNMVQYSKMTTLDTKYICKFLYLILCILIVISRKK